LNQQSFELIDKSQKCFLHYNEQGCSNRVFYYLNSSTVFDILVLEVQVLILIIVLDLEQKLGPGS